LPETFYDLDDERPDGPPRRYEDRHNRFREIAATLLAFSGGLALLFLFFALIGAVDLGEATGLAVAAVVFALIWSVGVWLRRRAGENTGRVTRADRERRGF
jgi:O-antigen/teichoic acid export membrane protein